MQYDSLAQKSLVFPNPARVIFGACNYGVAFVVESARKDLILVSVEHLHFGPRISVPHSAGLVTARRDDFVPLWIELDFRYFVLVTLQQRRARTSEYIIHSCKSIRWGSRQLVARAVEGRVQYLIIVPAESFNALTGRHVPELAGSIDGASEAILSREVELSAR